MLGYLSKEDKTLHAHILHCRSLGRSLNLEEQFAKRLVNFDWSYYTNQDVKAWRAGKRAEEDLVADIDASDLPNGVKSKLLRLFQLPEAEARAALEVYDWLAGMDFIDKDPTKGLLALAFAGVSEEQYNRYKALHRKLESLGEALLAANCTGRLIMTDDNIDPVLIRERATEEMAKHKDAFFFGIALPQHLQDEVDDIVRSHKQAFVNMVNSGAASALFTGLNIDRNNPNGVWLVTLAVGQKREVFGFFLNPMPTMPRKVWLPREQWEAKKTESPMRPATPTARQERLKNAVPGSFGKQFEPKPEVKEEPRKKTVPALSNRPTEIPTNGLSNKARKQAQKQTPAKKRQQFTQTIKLGG